MRKTTRIIAFSVLLAMLVIVPVDGQNSASILLIYGDTNDRTNIEQMLSPYDVEITTVLISNLKVNHISDQDLVIFVSSAEFSTDDDVEIQLNSYLQTEDHNFIGISPHFDEFSDTLETTIGIENFEEVTENTTVEWTMTFETNYANYTSSDTLTYTGLTSLVDVTTEANVIASYTSTTSEDSEDFELPKPAMWNVTNNAPITILPIALEVQSGLHLSQFPTPLASLIGNLLQVTFGIITDNLLTQTSISSSGSSTEATSTSQTTNGNEIQIGSLSFDIFNAMIIFLVIILMQILGVLRWIFERFSGVLVFVVGAFYNISDRTLSHNEVIMHTARSDILEFLNHVGSFGAHLREIKSVTGLGTGSLLWHLQMLEDYQFIDKYNIGKFTVFVSENHQIDAQLKEIELNLQSKYTLEMLNELINAGQEEILVSTIADSTSISQRALRRLFAKLAAHDVIEINKYPKMSIKILNLTIIRQLYQSFDLRSTYSQGTETPVIEQMS